MATYEWKQIATRPGEESLTAEPRDLQGSPRIKIVWAENAAR